jgi:radical SAM superfamily enzyme YgiQ (UPF0313 family)
MMKKIEIALVSLTSPKHTVLAENYGLGVLAGYLEKVHGNSITIETFDQQFRSLEEISFDLNQGEYNIIGFSVPIGSIHSLLAITSMLLLNSATQVIAGGAIPTHRPRDVLKICVPNGMVCIGEGELAISGLVDYCKGIISSHHDIPNIAFINDGGVHFTHSRLLDDLTKISNPFRTYTKYISDNGGQAYIETSRGCSWNRCTFCAIREKGKQRREIPNNAFLSNYLELLKHTRKQQEIVFTDEEFMGAGIETVFRAIRLAEDIESHGARGNFYIATSVKSIANSNDDEFIVKKREEAIVKLNSIGLGRVFLGIESGSKGQLKRYAKGTTPEEIIIAISVLKNHNIDIDIGMIIFDPLMSLCELKENLAFIENAGIIGLISVLPHEVRVQENTPILRMLRNYEKETNQKILGDFDLNTLNYPIVSYKNTVVHSVVLHSMQWQEKYYEFWYALKGRIRSISPLSNSAVRFELAIYFKRLQQLELDLIKAFIESIEEARMNLNEIIIKYESHRSEIMREILDTLNDKSQLDPNNKIKEGIELYRQRLCNNV